MKRVAFFLLILIPLSVSARHPIHLSVINLEINKESTQISYSIRLFQEDILFLINELVHQELHKGRTEKDAFSDKTLIPNYFNKAFNIYGDGKIIESKLVRQENSSDEVWLYFSAELSKQPDVLTIVNNIYTEFYSDQVNMVILSYNGIQKGLTFDKNNTTQLIALNNI